MWIFSLLFFPLKTTRGSDKKGEIEGKLKAKKRKNQSGLEFERDQKDGIEIFLMGHLEGLGKPT